MYPKLYYFYNIPIVIVIFFFSWKKYERFAFVTFADNALAKSFPYSVQ